jgi:hypothetical protein
LTAARKIQLDIYILLCMAQQHIGQLHNPALLAVSRLTYEAEAHS